MPRALTSTWFVAFVGAMNWCSATLLTNSFASPSRFGSVRTIATAIVRTEQMEKLAIDVQPPVKYAKPAGFRLLCEAEEEEDEAVAEAAVISTE